MHLIDFQIKPILSAFDNSSPRLELMYEVSRLKGPSQTTLTWFFFGFSDHLPLYVDILYHDKKLTFLNYLSTYIIGWYLVSYLHYTYPHLIMNIVYERPLA